MEYDILILAGGQAPEDLRQYADFDNKGAIKLGGRMMIEYVVDALRAAPGAGRILVMGPKEPFEKVLAGKVWRVEPAKNTMTANLKTGMEILHDSNRILVSTADVPLITPEIVGRFCDSCSSEKGGVLYSIIEKKYFQEKFPSTKRTFAPARDGVFTGGNLVMMRPDALKKVWPIIDNAIAARKSPIKLVKIIGFGFLLKFIFRRATIADLENRIEKILGMPVKAMRVGDPEIGIDVDKPSDFDLVRDVIEK